jgi:hypothetical protein
MLMSIVMCICIQPLDVNANEPLPTRRLGDYVYYYPGYNNVYGYVGTDKDVVIPIINNDPIEIYTFGKNRYIRNVTLNDKVWSVNDWAFKGCRNLRNIFVDPDNEFYSSIDGVLFNKEGTTLIIYPQGRIQTEYHIPEGTLDVSGIAFRVDRSFLDFRPCLKRIYLPESVEEFIVDIETLKAVYVDSKNEKYMSIDGMLIERKTGELVLYPEAKSKRFISPDGVKSIGENVFKQKGIRYAEFNDDLSKIGEHAFAGCRLRKVDIPDNVSLIEAFAFDNNRIRNLKLSDSVRIIDSSAFSNNKIRKLRIGSCVEVIGATAFLDNRITDLKLNDLLEYINGGAFADNKITRLELNDSLIWIGERAFKNNRITKLKLNASLEYIGEYAFFRNNIRGELILPASLEYIGEYAFTSERISKVVISDGVLIEGNLFGSDRFKKVYDEYGAGEYIRNDEGEWIKVN